MLRAAVLTIGLVLGVHGNQGLKACRKHNDCGTSQSCFFAYDKNHKALETGYCFSGEGRGQEEQRLLEDTLSELVMLEESSRADNDPSVKKFSPQGMKVSSLSVVAEEGKEAKIVLKSGDQKPYSLGVRETRFALTNGDTDVMTVTSAGDIILATASLAAGSLSADKGFIVNDVPQWSLVHSEDFGKTRNSSGYVTSSDGTEPQVKKCQNGLYLLGFQSPSISMSKTYQNLPAHDMVMIKAVYHFIDDWGGETGYMAISTGEEDPKYVWTESYNQMDYQYSVDACGNPKIGEGRFTAPVEVALRHTADAITVKFGTYPLELTNGNYGVSLVEIYVRNSEAA